MFDRNIAQNTTIKATKKEDILYVIIGKNWINFDYVESIEHWRDENDYHVYFVDGRNSIMSGEVKFIMKETPMKPGDRFYKEICEVLEKE